MVRIVRYDKALNTIFICKVRPVLPGKCVLKIVTKNCTGHFRATEENVPHPDCLNGGNANK